MVFIVVSSNLVFPSFLSTNARGSLTSTSHLLLFFFGFVLFIYSWSYNSTFLDSLSSSFSIAYWNIIVQLQLFLSQLLALSFLYKHHSQCFSSTSLSLTMFLNKMTAKYFILFFFIFHLLFTFYSTVLL